MSNLRRPEAAISEEIPRAIYVRLPQVLARYPVAKSTLYSWIQQGRFPKPVRLGPRTVAWTE